MDPRTSAQDIKHCELCDTAVVQMHCDTCLINLCKACLGEHFSADLSKPHKIVDFKDRKSTPLYPGCTSHDKERCEMYCKSCDEPICTACVASENHSGHKIIQILTLYHDKKRELEIGKEDMKKNIYPVYQDIVSEVQKTKSQLDEKYGDLSTAITKHGEDWHKEIDKVVMKLKAEVDNMKDKHQNALKEHIDEMNQRISDIDDEIRETSKLLESNDISVVLHFNTRITEFRKIPPTVKATYPHFTPMKCQHEQFLTQFGKLSELSTTSEEHGHTMKTPEKSPETGSSPSVKQLLDEPQIITINTGYIFNLYRFYNVACLNDEEIWTSADDSTMKLYSIGQGSLLKSITTKSGTEPWDIAVTQSGDLVYTDNNDRSVNIVKNEKIEEVIRSQNWIPISVCSTSSGDMLVIMQSDDYSQSKVVHYSGSTEKQTIQFDDEGKPLYSAPDYKYITENKNLDICVSDWEARAVVVVNQAGKLRFRYKEQTSLSQNQSFSPRGITTDSQSHILTADDNNHCVHIIDQDGQFLRYINSGLSKPWGLCTDTNDNLFVVQFRKNRQVKKIKYLQ